MGTAVIIGMATATVSCAILQKIFTSVGKVDEAQMMDFACKSGLAVTAFTTFTSVIKAVRTLG